MTARDRAIQSAARLSKSLERMIAGDFAAVLDRAGDAAAAQVEHGHHGGAEHAASAQIIASAGRFGRRLQAAAMASAQHTTSGLHGLPAFEHGEAKFDEPYGRAIAEWAQQHAAAKIVNIDDTTREKVRAILAAGIDAGDGNAAIAARLRNVVGGDGGNDRAMMIARTETHTATQFGAAAATKASGLKLVKEWGATEDERTRPAHAEADGQVAAMDGTFTVGGEKLRYPGDPQGSPKNIINCRCVALYRPRRPGEKIPVAQVAAPEPVPAVPARPISPAVPAPPPLPAIPKPTEPDDLERSIESARRNAESIVRDLGQQTGKEHLRWVDLATGELADDAASGEKNVVEITPALAAAISKPNRRIEVHHNHPSDSSLSRQDLIMVARYPGLERVYAHGAAGSRYMAMDVAEGIETVYTEAARYFGPEVYWLRDISIRDSALAGKIWTHAVAVALDAAGWIKYDAQLASYLQTWIDAHADEFKAMIAAMARKIGRPSGEKSRSDVAPAFIDPPDRFAPLSEWQDFLAQMQELSKTTAGIEPFIIEALREIARLSETDKSSTS